MIETACHCGAIKLEINAEVPESLNSCNCSLCHRYGSLTAYFPASSVTFQFTPDSILRYSWGDKNIEFIHCNRCGCFSHWEDIREEKEDRVGINARLFTNINIEGIRIRRFDGAKTWKYLD